MIASDWPVLTDRLSLRPVEASDAAAFLSWRSRPEVMLYMYQHPWTAELAAKKLVEWSGRRTLDEPGNAIQLAIARREAPEALIGEIMLKRAEGAEQGEIGWTLHPDAHGKGFATEAARAALGLAFERFGFHRMLARLDEDNQASARLCQRLGMRLEAHLIENDRRPGDDAWANELDYAILASEFVAQDSATLRS